MLLIKKYKSWALRSKLLGERVPDSETKAHIGEFYKKKKRNLGIVSGGLFPYTNGRRLHLPQTNWRSQVPDSIFTKSNDLTLPIQPTDSVRKLCVRSRW